MRPFWTLVNGSKRIAEWAESAAVAFGNSDFGDCEACLAEVSDVLQSLQRQLPDAIRMLEQAAKDAKRVARARRKAATRTKG